MASGRLRLIPLRLQQKARVASTRLKWSWFERRYLDMRRAAISRERSGKAVLWVVSDSHGMPLCRRRGRALGRVAVLPVSGATAYGLGSQDSSSQAAEKIRAFLPVDSPSDVLFHFGEIDCNVAAWLMSAERRETIEAVVAAACRRYVAFVEGLQVAGRIYILGVPPPVQASHARLSPTNARSRVSASASERDRIVTLFNELLRSAAEGRGWVFLDLHGAVHSGSPEAPLAHRYQPWIADHHMRSGPWRKSVTALLGASGHRL